MSHAKKDPTLEKLDEEFMVAVTSLLPWQGTAIQTEYPRSTLEERTVSFGTAKTDGSRRPMVIVRAANDSFEDIFYAPDEVVNAKPCASSHAFEGSMTKQEAGTDADTRTTWSCSSCGTLFRDFRKGSTINEPVLPQQ